VLANLQEAKVEVVDRVVCGAPGVDYIISLDFALAPYSHPLLLHALQWNAWRAENAKKVLRQAAAAPTFTSAQPWFLDDTVRPTILNYIDRFCDFAARNRSPSVQFVAHEVSRESKVEVGKENVQAYLHDSNTQTALFSLPDEPTNVKVTEVDAKTHTMQVRCFSVTHLC
jgi:hypothetical protein